MIKNWRCSTNISHYLGNSTTYGHSYNGIRIVTRMRSIQCCHFRWQNSLKQRISML